MRDNQKAAGRFFIVLCCLTVIGCSGYSVMRNQTVPEIPDARYERMIKLDNPDGQPDRTLAGLIHVTGRATVCTDYPREVVIYSYDDLTFMEKQAYPFYQNYLIQDGQETIGYVSIPVDYRVVIWRRQQDPQCQYKVGIIMPVRSVGYSPHLAVDLGVSAW